MGRIEELLASRAELDKRIQAEYRKVRLEALAKIKALAAEHGLTADDLTKAIGANKIPRKPKYRDPKTGATWAGGGSQPKWFKEHIKAGKSPEVLEISTQKKPAAKMYRPKQPSK